MNKDAQAWIDRYQSFQAPGDDLDHEAMLDAMRWAYADAARICREQMTDHNQTQFLRGDEADYQAACCAEAIEERAK